MPRRTRGAATGAASQTSSSMRQFARERPLLVVGAGVAVGMALGALLPWSRMEDELLGEQAEKLKESARDLASEGYEKVKSVAQHTYEAASDTLRGESKGGSGDNGGVSYYGESKTYGTDPYPQ